MRADGGRSAFGRATTAAREHFRPKLRVFHSVARRASGAVLPVVTIGAGVFALGALQATSYSTWPPFVASYGVLNLLPSVTWFTLDANLVWALLDSPTEAPRVPRAPADLIYIKHVESLRHVLASAGLISQFLVFVHALRTETMLHYERVRLGTALFSPSTVEERFFRLCGSSPLTATSIARYGSHVVPVTRMNAQFVNSKLFGYPSTTPRFVSVEDFGDSKSYDAVRSLFAYGSRSAFLKGERNVLCVEADGTSENDPLSLGRRRNVDERRVDVEEAWTAARKIGDVALEATGTRKENSLTASYTTFNVYLGNSSKVFFTGANSPYSLRDRASTREEFDVVLDSGAIVLRPLLAWLESNKLKDEPELVIESGDEGHHLLLQRAAGDAASAFAVLDPVAELRREDDVKRPRVIVHRRDAETMNAVLALKNAPYADLAKCLVVVEKVETQRELLTYSSRSNGPRFAVLCTSTLQDDALRAVRQLARRGYTSEAIQEWVDARYGRAAALYADDEDEDAV